MRSVMGYYLFFIFFIANKNLCKLFKFEEQCGGDGYTGDRFCESGAKCVSIDQWYSQVEFFFLIYTF